MTVTSQEAVAVFKLALERVHGPAYAALVPQEIDEALFKATLRLITKRMAALGWGRGDTPDEFVGLCSDFCIVMY
jgi:hypothetical protein